MIAFVLQHRLKPVLFSREWLFTWLKRWWSLPALLGYSLQSFRWRIRGAKIDGSSVIARLEVQGDARNLSIGQHCCLGIVRMQAHARINIGDGVVINDGVRLVTGSHDIHSSTYDHVFASIGIEDHAWIATDAMILKGVTIGRGAVVAAGSVVTKSVAPFAVVGGNPAKVIGTRRIESFEYVPCSWFGPVMAWIGRNPGLRPQDAPVAGNPGLACPTQSTAH